MLNLITQLRKFYYPYNTTVAFLVYVFNDKDLLMSVALRDITVAVVLGLTFKIISSLQKMTFQKCTIPNHDKSKILRDVQLP